MKILNVPSRYRQDMLRQPSLMLCLVLDFIGFASYSIPVLGEFADIIWAPLSGLIFFSLFGGWKGGIGGVFSMVEELLPGTDIIPSFTIMWMMRNSENKKRMGSR